MKRLAALFVISAMLGICTSSYGYFLIYTISGSLKGTEGAVDIEKETTNFRGYLVMNIDEDTNSLTDANLIFSGGDPNNHRVYVQLNASDSNGFLDASILYRDRRTFYELNGNPPFDFKIFAVGDVHNRAIGLPRSKKIVPSLWGAITNESGMLFAVGQELAGTGSLSVSLYSTATNGVNNPNNDVSPHTPDGIIQTLKAILADHHYREVSIPAP